MPVLASGRLQVPTLLPRASGSGRGMNWLSRASKRSSTHANPQGLTLTHSESCHRFITRGPPPSSSNLAVYFRILASKFSFVLRVLRPVQLMTLDAGCLVRVGGC